MLRMVECGLGFILDKGIFLLVIRVPYIPNFNLTKDRNAHLAIIDDLYQDKRRTAVTCS